MLPHFALLAFSLFFSIGASAWSPFGPSSYGECVEDGLNAGDGSEWQGLQRRCENKFDWKPGEGDEDNDLFDARLKECGVDPNSYTHFLPDKSESKVTRELLENLVSKDAMWNRSTGLYFMLQNNNDFYMGELLIGISTDGTDPCGSKAFKVECSARYGMVSAGEAEKVTCAKAKEFKPENLKYCFRSLSIPGSGSGYMRLDKPKMYLFLRSKGFCD